MQSYLFGSGVPKFAVGLTEVNIDNSFIESIEMEPRVIEHESIINTTRNYTNIKDNDHFTVTVLCRLHKKTTGALAWFKNFYSLYNKTEVDIFFPSQTADGFVDENGSYVKFYLQITELFPLETIWSYDSFRMIFKSKKPVDLGSAQVQDGSGSVPMDTAGSVPTDTDEVAPTD